jgi:NTE family protein
MRSVTHLLFSSGSVLTISYIGALMELDTSGILSQITKYSGVSAGAIIATCLAIGYTLQELKDIVMKMDFASVQDIGEDSPIHLLELYGFDSGEKLLRFIRALVKVKGYSDTTTFMDLSSAGCPQLVMWATELESGTLRRFSAADTPSYTICGALRASVSIPILFAPILAEDTGHLLIDGGVLNHYPIAYLADDEREGVLGFYARNITTYDSPTDIVDYLKAFIGLILRSKNDDTPDIFREKTILIETEPVTSAASFSLSTEYKIALIEKGAIAAKKWLAEREL